MLYKPVQLHTLHPLAPVLRWFACLLVLGWLAGCATPFNPDERLGVAVPTRAAIPGVPLIRQEAFYCGPTSIAMVLHLVPEQVARIWPI